MSISIADGDRFIEQLIARQTISHLSLASAVALFLRFYGQLSSAGVAFGM